MARLRLAELVGALSLATDLGMGQPLEQAQRTCLLSMRLGRELGLTSVQLHDLYFVALLRFLGCTADAHETAAVVGGDEIAFRAIAAPVLGDSSLAFVGRVLSEVGRGRGTVARLRTAGGFLANAGKIRGGVAAHCELADNLARRLALGAGVRKGLAHALERWDGHGLPGGVSGEDIEVTSRIVYLARDVEVLSRAMDLDEVVRAVNRRRGKAYDPTVVEAFRRCRSAMKDELEASGVWERVVGQEPEPRVFIEEARLDSALEVFADFADVKSPYTLGHSRGVADLAGRAAMRMELAGTDCRAIHRAGLVHDLGRVAVANGVWEKQGPLSAGEWELVRLHSYYSERILARSAALAPLASLAGPHHERMDGSGYHRGSTGDRIPVGARLIGVADAFRAMTEPRPYRPARTPTEAAKEIETEVAAGRLDREAAEAVLAVAGQPASFPGASRPRGLSEREVEVLRLIARGMSKRAVADALVVSPATVDHHVRHVYQKIGVATRAGAAVFALENGLLRE